MGWMIRGSNPGRGWKFFLLHSVQTGSGAHPASYPMGARVKWPGCDDDHSPPSIAEMKNASPIPPLPNTPSLRGAQLKHREDFTFF
jgi:hypothetical protein